MRERRRESERERESEKKGRERRARASNGKRYPLPCCIHFQNLNTKIYAGQRSKKGQCPVGHFLSVCLCGKKHPCVLEERVKGLSALEHEGPNKLHIPKGPLHDN